MNQQELILNVEQTIRTLSEDIGSRPAASDNHRKTVQFIDSVFNAAGLYSQIQEYPCPEWHFEGVSLSDDGNDYEAVPNIYTLPSDICCKNVIAFSLDELRVLRFEDSDFKIPSVTVSKTIGDNILNAGTSKLTLNIKSGFKECKSESVIAQTYQKTEEKMIICGHFDTN